MSNEYRDTGEASGTLPRCAAGQVWVPIPYACPRKGIGEYPGRKIIWKKPKRAIPTVRWVTDGGMVSDHAAFCIK